MKVKVKDLQAGDYVVPAKATVAEVDLFAGLAIVDFTDKTATAPIPQHAMVEIIRKDASLDHLIYDGCGKGVRPC